jgi:hypothetical protein
MTTAAMLAAVETAIENRLSGEACEEWQDGSQRFRGATLTELFNMRDRLRGQVAAETGGVFSLAEFADI